MINRDSLGPRLRALYIVGVICVTFSLAIVRTSTGNPQSGIIGNDDRRVIEQLSAPWGAIGRERLVRSPSQFRIGLTLSQGAIALEACDAKDCNP